MHDNWIIATALCVSALGIIGMMFALVFLELPESALPDARAMADGTPLRVRGTVTSINTRTNITTITITQPTTLTIIIRDNVTINKNDCIIVQGKKTSYKNNAQLEAEKIESCSVS